MEIYDRVYMYKRDYIRGYYWELDKSEFVYRRVGGYRGEKYYAGVNPLKIPRIIEVKEFIDTYGMDGYLSLKLKYIVSEGSLPGQDNITSLVKISREEVARIFQVLKIR